MLSFTTRRDLYGKLTRDASSDNLSLGDTLMNEEEKKIINSRAWDFIQRVFTDTTVASQQFYNLPVNYKKLIGQPTITVGSVTYSPQEAPDRATWDWINSVSFTSDVPQFFYIFNKQIGFFPTPSSSSNTITLPIEIQARDLSIADYTTGTILSVANGATTVEGTGSPAWTSGMAGRFIQISEDNSATSGDNQWYEIASVTDVDTLELVLPYQGTSIAAATQAYKLAQISILPDGYHNLPVYKAAQEYYIQNIEAAKADRFKTLYDDLFRTLISDRGSKTSDVSINDGRNIGIKNPNLYLNL